MISQHHEVPEILGAHDAESEIRLLVEAFPSKAWFSGTHKERLYQNNCWDKYTGRPISQSHGNEWQRSIHPDDYPGFLENYSSHFDRREPFDAIFRLRRHDGTYRWHKCCGNPVPIDPQKPFRGYVGSCIDIHDQIEAHAAMERALNAKTEFLAAVSHEIRTPLNGIINLSDLLVKETNLPTSVVEDLIQINQSAKHLKGIVNDVLDSAKMEHGVTLCNIDFNINDTVRECIGIVQSSADEKHLEIKLRTSLDSGDCNVYSDQNRFKQVVINLLSNAIKFTEQGSIIVFLDRTANTYVIKVVDTGCGISAEFRKKLFEPFS